MKEKILKDIRYYESDRENISGNSLPNGIGSIFTFSKEIAAIGQRIARKLNEYSFISGEFDHIYINFSTALSENEIVIAKRRPEKWLIYIDYGVASYKINDKTEKLKNDFIVEATIRSLKHLYNSQEDKLSKIERVEQDIRNDGSNLEFVFKVKETSSYRIVLSDKIKPTGGTSPFIVQYADKKNGSSFRAKVLDLEFYDDIYFLVDSISVKKGFVVLSPKKSYKAGVFNRRYDIPIEIEIKSYLFDS